VPRRLRIVQRTNPRHRRARAAYQDRPQSIGCRPTPIGPQGTGLGLAIVDHSCAAMPAYVRVGASLRARRFTLISRLYGGELPVTKRILVIEDEPAEFSVCVTIELREAYEVSRVGKIFGEDARNAISTAPEPGILDSAAAVRTAFEGCASARRAPTGRRW